MDDEQGRGTVEFYGTALLRTPGVREYVRTVRVPGGAWRFEYLGADDEWHDAEGSPLSMTDVIAARDRSMNERRQPWIQALTLSDALGKRELSVEDARKVATVARLIVAGLGFADHSLIPAGIAHMLRERWPHLDWELRNGEIIPFERPPSEVVEAHAKSVNARYAGIVEATSGVDGLTFGSLDAALDHHVATAEEKAANVTDVEIKVNRALGPPNYYTGATLEEAILALKRGAGITDNAGR